ncbi:hypothetical protein SCA31_23510, partial [Chryseobacterium sp. SIMBA_028]
GPVHFSGVRIQPTGKITGHHQAGKEFLEAGNQLRRVFPQPSPGTGPQHRVNDGVVPGAENRKFLSVSGTQLKAAPSGREEGSQPFGMHF